jgi:hypothetical protein
MCAMTPSVRTTLRGSGLAWLSLGLLALACAVARPRSLPPQEWWSGRGPVVPHDTFPADCSLCHAGGSWHEIRADFAFDHALETGVPLEGAHAQAECLRCHNDRGPVELFARRGCAGCHEDVHRGKLGKNCADCHDQDLWRPRRQIDLHARTRFPLVGAHAATGCFRCHPGAEVGNFDRTPIECVSCHADDLARALVPDHQANGYVDDCQRCHIPTSWTGAGFNHGFFPLTGAHASVACTQCHAGGVYAGTPRDCASCHLADYNGTSDPDHAAAGFPTTCQDCHTTASWSGAGFNHATFPLTGAHASAACTQCHAGGVYAGTPRDCASCHLADYNGTNDPDHAAAGFPTSCEACHGTTTWNGAMFDHSFPLSGPHDRSCIECHQTPGNYRSFSCTHCHEHRQSEMDAHHGGVPGYAYNSAACYGCHPNGDH